LPRYPEIEWKRVMGLANRAALVRYALARGWLEG